MNRLNIAAGNWKMNMDLESGLQLSQDIANGARAENVQTILCPPALFIKSVLDQVIHTTNLHIAAQNCHHEKGGAHTGEISVDMLSSLGIKYVIVGHSERRANQNETAEILTKKIDLLLESGMKPIFCCGEPLEIRQSGKHVAFVTKQLQDSLFHLSAKQLQGMILAYEPIWAIGTGETASPDQAQEMHAAIRGLFAEKYGQDIAHSMSILYGGSVKPGNAKEIFSKADVDGGLVGGASLKADDFLQIINSFD